MATDIDPCRDSRQLENETYATNVNNKTVVRVEDEAAIAALNLILAAVGGSAGTPFFRSAGSITTGVPQTLINETVGAGKTLTVKSVRVTSRKQLTYEILEDATVIGTGRIGSGNLNDEFIFVVDKVLSAGTVLKVNVLGIGPNSDVEVYLQALEN